MDALVSPIMEVAKWMWSSTANHFSYFFNLEHNLQSLKTEMEQLKETRDDVLGRVEYDEGQQMKRRSEVDGWFNRVQRMEEKVKETLEQGNNQAPCFGVSWLPKNCYTSYKLGKKVSQLLDDVSKLKTEGSFGEVAYKLPPAQFHERPMEKTVGLDSTLEKVLSYVRDEYVGIIGLYGMPGVGKTTLLNKINNTCSSLLCPTSTGKGFDMVIWAVVSNSKQAGSIEKVQEVIRNKFMIPDNIWKDRSQSEKVAILFNVLKGKKFLLLLDDLWDRFDLLRAGIPYPVNGSKVIFTTRSEEVCVQMQAHKKIKIECLPAKEALELFRMNVGEDTLNCHPQIPKLAQVIANKCHGLPLALVTAGRAMASTSRTNYRDWKHAIDTLKKDLPKLSGMVDDVFPVLKLSYDSLPNDTLKSCFLHFSIFPEDHVIGIDELIDLWIGEGFVVESSETHEARNHGHHLIESLKLASLLQTDELEMSVTMHDLIREMALWIACDDGKTRKILVQEGEAAAASSNEVLGSVERMSLWGQSIEDVTKITSCPNLLTLIVRDVNFHGNCFILPNDFFWSLKVIDLSRGNSLELLEGIGELINLRYLNLSGTALKELPVELKKLKKLMVLILNDMANLKQIAKELVSSLPSLQMFSKLESPFLHLHSYEELCNGEIALLEAMKHLKHVSDICLTLCNKRSADYLFDSQKLNGYTRALSLVTCSGLTSIRGSGTSLQYLESLSIHYCRSLVQGFVLEVDFSRSSDYFHNLTDLCIHHCPNMKQVVSGHLGDGEDEDCSSIFSSLKRLRLSNLPMLKTIYPRALRFPSLISVEVYECHHLRHLPFDSSSAKNSLKKITGEQSWWDGLRWEDEGTKRVFSSKFHPDLELNL